ncbi:MAG: transposase [Bacteroidales bacterium]|nr:transposase [Bacteroidales bacterium]
MKSSGITIARDHLPRVFDYMAGEVRILGGVPIIVGGMPDHIHMLVALPRTMSIADFMMNVKKGSSKWIKGIDGRYRSFAWQEGYGAFSVSHSMKEKTINYISTQEVHHRKKSFMEEYRSFLEANGIEYDERYL